MDRQIRVAVEYARALNNMPGLYACASGNKAHEYFAGLERMCDLYKDNSVGAAIEYAKALRNRLAIAAKNKEYDEKVDWAFHEITALHDQYKGISAELTIMYISAHYYMYCIMLCNKRSDACRRLLEAVVQMCSDEDSDAAHIASQWLEAMKELDSRESLG